MADNSYRSYIHNIFLEPTPENILGFIGEEAVKQLSGENRKGSMAVPFSSKRAMAFSVVFESHPMLISETVEISEPQPIAFVTSQGTSSIAGLRS